MSRDGPIATLASLVVGLAALPAVAAGQNVTDPFGGFGGDPPGGGSIVAFVQDPAVLALVVVGGTAAVVALERRSESSIHPQEDDADGTDPLESRRRAVATAVGRAADALAAPDADLTFRTWADLAGALGIENPATATAGDLRAAAVESGLDPDDADRLAEQFDVLRYGGAATDRRERDAVEVLRAIERRYEGDGDERRDREDDEDGNGGGERPR